MYYSMKKAKKAAFVLSVMIAFATTLGGLHPGGNRPEPSFQRGKITQRGQRRSKLRP